ncbi:MAG: phosphoribosylglycinamide formyltransferase [Chitinophagaceae bacterium]|nr:phosphoribosylglycinamide formyltransferase [Chitinophagaceae bacterium]MCB9044721.1 phosphoribosylglycinamide formyltransferase [Chitinophagales bacterium]
MHSLIIFASGKGSNAQAIIDYFKNNGGARVSLIVSNKAEAGVFNIARAEGVPSMLIDKIMFNSTQFIEDLKMHNPALIILAGFLWKIPTVLVKAFPEQIVNIHPALLPKYGGKGMYGSHVHESVISAGETESGITIHYVDEVYDNGNKILQAHCPIQPGDTADILAESIHKLEHFFYPRTIEYLLENI